MKMKFKGRVFEYEIVDNIYVFENLGLYNIDLKSLEKFKNTFQHEYSVKGNFNCNNNQLTSLVGSPTTVGGYFSCYNNKLQSLAGSPTYVGGNFDCDNTPLKSLAGSPTTVKGNFYCYNNPELRPCKEEIEGKFRGLQGIYTDNEYVIELFKRERIELFI